MKQLLTAFILVSCLLSAQGQATDTMALIDQVFSKWNNATPGGSVLVSQNNKILYHKAFGLADLEHNVPNTIETIFESGSVAKQFTAASILLLASEGKLSLQDDVRKYVPELPAYNSSIIIQHLLNHISGLKDWGTIGGLTGWPRTTRVYTQELALQIMSKQRSLNFTPGSEYSYSNSNYSLLVTIVERVSKQSLADFTRTRFFEPLGMTSTQWRDNFREVVPNRSIAYSKSGSTYQQIMPFENVHGHGGLLTTTGDLQKWNSLLETHQIGGDQVYNWRVQKGKLNNGQEISYAGGVSVNSFNGFTEISHSGATAGYRAWLAYYPQKKITIIVLSNDANSGIVGVGYEIAKLFLGQAADAQKTERKSITLSEADAKRLTGTYRSIRNFDVFGIAYTDGKILSNGRELNAAHRDTLYLANQTWILSKPGKILLKNSQDTSSYRKVNSPDLNPKSMQALNGIYVSEEADATWRVEVKDTEVWIHVKPGLSFKIKPSFLDGYVTDEFELVEFKRDKKGNVTGLEISQARAERVPFKKTSWIISPPSRGE